MPSPAISPVGVGATLYTITSSDAAIVSLSLTVPTTPSFPTVTVRYPAAAAGVQVTLVRGATTLALLPGPVDDSATFAARRVIATTAAAGPTTELTIEIRATSAPAAEAWSVRVNGLAGVTCSVEQPDNDPAALTITRVVSGPVASFGITPPATVGEKNAVTLTALIATGTALAPTVVGSPAPTVVYRWTYTGSIAIPVFPSASASQVFAFTAPGVYGNRVINIALDVTYGGAGIPAAFLTTTAAPQPLTITPRTQHVLLVLDRSGSMSGARWENAKTAARIMTQTYATYRAGVNAADRIALLVFEDQGCSWRAWGSAIDPKIAPVLAASTPANAATQICGVNFGPAGSCTPIGDGLYKGMQLLNALGVGDDPKFTIVLLTDGYENSGTIRVDTNSPVGGVAVREFPTARASLPDVDSRLTIYAVGLGGTVQEDVLDALPLPVGAGPAGIYRHVTDVADLQPAIAQMVSFSQEAQQVVPLPGAPPVADPAPLAQQRYFQLEAKVNRLALAVEWANAADTLELARRDWDALSSSFTGSFQPVAAAVGQCPTHGYVGVDVASLFGGEDAVPATEWRIVHKSAGVPQPIAGNDLLVFVDLHVKVEITFDRTQYRTGDPMVVTARVRAGSEPILGATVQVELARPGESLGTFLATNSQSSGTGQPPGVPASADPAAAKQALLQSLLARKDLTSLPIITPPKIFEDGTAQLFDDGLHHDGDAGDGNYANRYVNVDKEGSYTWRVYVTGTLADGSPFSRLIVISRWVGVQVNPASSPLTWVNATGAPAGFLAATISVVPRDKGGEYLGPFRSAEVTFATTAGTFDGDMVSEPSGAYVRRLIYPQNTTPQVTVIVQGNKFPPVTLGDGCLGFRRLLEAIKRLAGR